MPRTPLLALAALFLPLASTTAQGGVWVNRATAPGVASCNGEFMVYDAARQETIWFGRFTCRQTWSWNGSTWTQRATAAAPPATVGKGAFDSVRNVIVAVFGGLSSPLETWEWNGVAWTQRPTAPFPSRYSFGLAFDAARNVTVLFGGRDGTENGFADTWAWNGTAWTQVWLGGPTPRWSSGMTYDVQRQKVVLFGGLGPVNGTATSLGDTWEWNGSYWFNHFGVVGPSPRADARLAYDSRRQRTLLYGGYAAGLFQQTWEWNGSAWTQLAPTGTPGQVPTELAYDAARDVFVTMTSGTTWEYVPDNTVPATFSSYGAGCAGPNGIPVLTNVAGSLPRIGSTLQLRLTNLPPSLLNVPLGFIGFDASSWNGIPLPLSLTLLGFPGCDALLAPIRSDALFNNSGTADWNIALPMNALGLGLHVYFQAAVLVPGWNAGGFVFSNGGHAVLGSP
jgi:hypothetical protein